MRVYYFVDINSKNNICDIDIKDIREFICIVLGELNFNLHAKPYGSYLLAMCYSTYFTYW